MNIQLGKGFSADELNEIRSEFPILHQMVHKRPLIYLDSAASAQKPRAVIDAISRYYQHDNANVHRGAHTLGDRATALFEDAREAVRAFLNAARREEIIWTRGTTEAINLVANGLSSRVQRDDEIIVTRMEHHANIVPWQMLAQRCGAALKVVELNAQGELLHDQLESLFNERTRILALTHASNVLGTINPVSDLIARARQRGIISVVDGAQSVPHFKVDVQALGCDFFAFSGHKLFGPTGIGVLYGRFDILDSLPPWQGGGEMIERVSFERTTYNALPYRFEAGTPAIAEAAGLHAALRYLQSLDQDKLHAHEQGLLQQATELSATVPGMRIVGQATHKVPVLSFLIEGLHPSDIGTLLDQQGIGIRTGHHCAMPLMEKLAIPGTARASFAFYNTPDEVTQLFAALQKIQRMFV